MTLMPRRIVRLARTVCSMSHVRLTADDAAPAREWERWTTRPPGR